MNLSKITSRDENIHKIKNRLTTNRIASDNLKTGDISGKHNILTQGNKMVNPSYNKISYGYKNDDIPFSSPKVRFENIPNIPESIEIEGSSPSIVKFKTTRAPSNPLQPLYKLQTYIQIKPEVPRFIRDSMKIDVLI